MGETEKAKWALGQALQLDPHNFEANIHMGAFYLRDRDLSKAREFTAKALRLRPGFPAALYQMGLVERASNHFPESVSQFEAAERAAPDWLEPHMQLAAFFYYRINRPDDGKREREAVARLSNTEGKP